MYADPIIHSDAARLEMAQADRKATQTWRFRDVKGRGPQGVVAILTSLIAFFVR